MTKIFAEPNHSAVRETRYSKTVDVDNLSHWIRESAATEWGIMPDKVRIDWNIDREYEFEGVTVSAVIIEEDE